MKFLKKLLKKRIYPYVTLITENSRFFSGQSAIIASRLNYANLEDLWDAEIKVFSQWGEDGIIDYLCEQLKISKPKILEIGAGNFSECNSRFASEFRNASVFAVDARPDLITNVDSHPLRLKTHLFAKNQWVTPDNVVGIESQARSLMAGIDIVSLDLDGNDYWVLNSLNLENVTVVIVEYNPLFGHKYAVTVPRNDKFERKKEHFSQLYYGASIRAFVNLLSKKGFSLIGTNRVGSNGFFVSNSSMSKIPLAVSQDFEKYTDWRIREARNQQGSFSYLSGDQRVASISNLPLLEIESGMLLKVEDVLN